jgi:hypothetical protein
VRLDAAFNFWTFTQKALIFFVVGVVQDDKFTKVIEATKPRLPQRSVSPVRASSIEVLAQQKKNRLKVGVWYCSIQSDRFSGCYHF